MSDPFHTYDIRGVYGKALTDELAYKIGKAIVKKYNLKKIVIGHDHRLSSPSLFKNLANGITDMGCDVYSIGTTATPILYHVCVEKEFPIGIMITASHNPKEYNGFKVCTKDCQLITYDAGIKDVEELCKNIDQIKSPTKTKGKITSADENKEYAKYVADKIGKKGKLNKKYKIAIDTGNGVAGPIVKEILRHIPNIELTELYFELDGNYPNHEANPLVEKNNQKLSEIIKDKKLNIGFAFDGDADRCIVLDENGKSVPTDLLLCVMAEEELKKHKKGKFYYDLRFSKIVKEYIEKIGGTPVMLRVGNPFYKEKMRYEGGIAAAELSGHVFYQENHGLDDGFYHMAKILSYIDDLDKPISNLIEPFRKYHQSEEINNKVKDADIVLKEIKKKYKDAKISELDGVTVEYKTFWFNIRKSNTEPLVRLRLEADTKSLLDEKLKEVTGFIEKFK
jgi:phosphomannomutase